MQILESELLFEEGRPPIGEGGFAKVVRARYTPAGSPAGFPGRMVAVKSARIDYVKGVTGISEGVQADLLKEVAKLGSLHHENIINLFGVCFHADGTLSVVLQLADGDLLDAIDAATGGKVPLNLQLKFGLDVARGLAYLHTPDPSSNPPKPVTVHCDIKPANVLVLKGVAKLADFGLAKTLSTSLASCVKNSFSATGPIGVRCPPPPPPPTCLPLSSLFRALRAIRLTTGTPFTSFFHRPLSTWRPRTTTLARRTTGSRLLTSSRWAWCFPSWQRARRRLRTTWRRRAAGGPWSSTPSCV